MSAEDGPLTTDYPRLPRLPSQRGQAERSGGQGSLTPDLSPVPRGLVVPWSDPACSA
jgi:hypothetical protein